MLNHKNLGRHKQRDPCQRLWRYVTHIGRPKRMKTEAIRKYWKICDLSTDVVYNQEKRAAKKDQYSRPITRD